MITEILDRNLFMAKFLLGLAAGVIIAFLATRARFLNRDGGIAAGVVGTIVFGFGGLGWALLLLTFFITSSALSKLFRSGKSGLDQHFSKGSRRDASQVLANGGVAAVLAVLFFITLLKNPANSGVVVWLGFAASLAGANADTWATELGLLNSRQPVLLTTFQPVPRGTSGAVSLVGTLAALAGSAVVGAMAVLSSLAGWAPSGGPALGLQFLLITASGLAGSFVDSGLGATLQAVYTCPVCDKETERHPQHTCGTPTTLKRGKAWLNNDWVNGACTLSAGLIGILLAVAIL
jgi:uncharacterized protein (TIGR00297 family)